MSVRLVTGPTVEPLTLDEAKAHLRLEQSADDDYVESLIKSSRIHTEQETSRGLIEQTWEYVAEEFPCEDYIELPKGTLRSVSFVKYIDDTGALITLDPSKYELDTKSRTGRIYLAHGEAWPAARDRWNAVQVEFKVGYGTAASSVPEPLKQAMLVLLAQMYEQRTMEVVGTIIARTQAATYDNLIAPYRLRKFK